MRGRADIIYNAAAPVLKRGGKFDLGLAAGNTMIELCQVPVDRFNRDGIALSRLLPWNLDEYGADEHHAAGHVLGGNEAILIPERPLPLRQERPSRR